jgi:hypothetical protein
MVVPGSVTATLRSGRYSKVPIILGANASKIKAFLPLYGPALSAQSGLNIPWLNLIGVLKGYIPSIDYVLPEADKSINGEAITASPLHSAQAPTSPILDNIESVPRLFPFYMIDSIPKPRVLLRIWTATIRQGGM